MEGILELTNAYLSDDLLNMADSIRALNSSLVCFITYLRYLLTPLNLCYILQDGSTDIGLRQNLALATCLVEGRNLDVQYMTTLLYPSLDRYNTVDTTHLREAVVANATVINGTTYFNLASLLFHQHRYSECECILDVLCSNVEEYEEPLIFKIWFLSLEVMIRLRQESLQSDSNKVIFREKSSRIFCCIEKINSVDISARLSLERLGQTQDDPHCASKQKPVFIRSFISFRMHLYRCRCLIELNQLKQSKKEIKNALEIFQRELRQYTDTSAADMNASISHSIGKLYFGCPVSPIDYQNQLALYIKVRTVP